MQTGEDEVIKAINSRVQDQIQRVQDEFGPGGLIKNIGSTNPNRLTYHTNSLSDNFWMSKEKKFDQSFFPSNTDDLVKTLGKKKLLESLNKMILIRNFEVRAESAYQHGHIGGFFHSYMGQEAIQTRMKFDS